MILIWLCSVGEAGKMADASTMLSISDPIHIVLIKTEASGETSLVSSNFFEWRTVLASSGNRMSMMLELKGTGSKLYHADS